MKYRPEIDGLRAIAVVPVILFHAGFTFFSGGYTGVDVFFVISGFLITTIILAELEKGTFSIINFYERRSRRILPLLFFILLLTIPFAWISLFDSDMIDYSESLIAVSTFCSNFLFVAESGYFDTSTELKPLLHTWSLAVEEQYYVIFPLAMILFWRFLNKNWILSLLIVAGLASLVLSEWATVFYPTHNFYLLPTRAWELAVGAITAVLLSNNHPFITRLQSHRIISEALSFTGLALILAGIFLIDEETPFPGIYALLPTIGSALIIAFASGKNYTGRLLSLKPMLVIGLISYSAYLWHHPIFAFAKHLSYFPPSITAKSLLCLAVFPIAYLSWQYVENPFRDKKRFSRKFIFIFSLVGSMFFIGAGILGVVNEGFPERSINTKLNVLEYNPDNRILQLESWINLDEAKPKLESASWFKDDNPLPNLLMIGNSHSKDLYNIFNSSEDAKTNFEFGRFKAQIEELASSDHKLYSSPSYLDADLVVIISKYSDQDVQVLESIVSRMLDDQKQIVVVKEVFAFTVENAKTKADLIVQEYLRNDLDPKVPEALMTLETEVNRAYYEDYVSGKSLRKSDKVIDRIQSAHPQVLVLDRMQLICDSDTEACFAINQNLEKYFYDYGHHTTEGAAFFGHRADEIGWVLPLVEKVEDK